MKCPFLSRESVFTCSADNEIYAPGLFELEELCLNGGKMCPRPSLIRFGIVHAGNGASREKKQVPQLEVAA